MTHPYQRKLARVLDRMGGLYTEQDIRVAIAAGKMQVFVEGETVAVTQICIFPRAKMLEVLLVVGDLDKLRVLHDQIMSFAAEIGAGLIQAYGRKGWLADAQRRGWKTKARTYLYQREM